MLKVKLQSSRALALPDSQKGMPCSSWQSYLPSALTETLCAVKGLTLHSACRLSSLDVALSTSLVIFPASILLLEVCLHCWPAGLDTSSAQDDSSISDWSEGDRLSGEDSGLSDWDTDSHADEQAAGAAESTAAPDQAAPVADEGRRCTCMPQQWLPVSLCSPSSCLKSVIAWRGQRCQQPPVRATELCVNSFCLCFRC